MGEDQGYSWRVPQQDAHAHQLHHAHTQPRQDVGGEEGRAQQEGMGPHFVGGITDIGVGSRPQTPRQPGGADRAHQALKVSG
jgi:hypothetical protein